MSRVLLLAGMHRSGTSMIANLLQTAGVDMGDEQLAPDIGNPQGYFEDAVVQTFHREQMAKAGITDGFTVSEDQVPIAVDDGARERAREIIASRGPKELWGWKDPRTALFLDLWGELLPDAKFLFVFRPPIAVLDSLMRRASNETVNADPATGLVLWRLYNSEMLRFSNAHPERSMWWETDRLPDDASMLVGRLRERFGLPLRDVAIDDIYVSTAYHRETRLRARMVAKRHARERKRCDDLYAMLKGLADKAPVGSR
jgi:O-antigen biosynthesis protein